MSEVFDGTVDVQDGAGTTTVQLDGTLGDATVGGGGQDGAVRVLDAAGNVRISLDEGDVIVRDGAGTDVFHVNGSNAAVYVGGTGNEGDLIVRDAQAREVIHANASNAGLYVGANGNEGDVIVRDGGGRETIHLDGGGSNITVRRVVGRTLRNVLLFDGGNAALYIGTNGIEGDIRVRDSAGRDVFQVDGNSAAVYIGADGNEGDLIIRDGSGRDVFHFTADFALMEVGAAGNEGDIRVRDAAGNVRIHLDGGAGDIRLHGADCAEHFDVSDADDVDEGTVLVIDDDGALCTSTSAYDRRVAGVVSGAGGYRPGILLDSFAEAPGRRPIALAGKVYCKVDASHGPVRVGDLLTTSDTAGHAMRVSEPARAFGSVLGKALAPLTTGRGLVPVLVTLQ